MRARRVALLADVHGNAPALAAVLREVKTENVDLLVLAGDLTWGPLVAETLALVRDYEAGPSSSGATRTEQSSS
ncbi:MAG: metallophosphoesterase family protein [Gaiellaceae bacterium]